jgi:hypothetical protein
VEASHVTRSRFLTTLLSFVAFVALPAFAGAAADSTAHQTRCVRDVYQYKSVETSGWGGAPATISSRPAAIGLDPSARATSSLRSTGSTAPATRSCGRCQWRPRTTGTSGAGPSAGSCQARRPCRVCTYPGDRERAAIEMTFVRTASGDRDRRGSRPHRGDRHARLREGRGHGRGRAVVGSGRLDARVTSRPRRLVVWGDSRRRGAARGIQLPVELVLRNGGGEDSRRQAACCTWTTEARRSRQEDESRLPGLNRGPFGTVVTGARCHRMLKRMVITSAAGSDS